jgi:hypothetical protein
MKTKSLGLLAITAVALAMPFTASAAVVSNIKVTDDKGALVVPTKSFTGTSVTIADPLGKQYNVLVKAANLTVGSYTYDTYFKVAAGVNTFSGAVNWISPVVSGSVKLLQGSTVLSSIVDGKAQYTGLQAGITYTVETKVTVKQDATLGRFNQTFGVTAAVPEPEEWAMMLVGAGLVSYQVRRKQKGLSQSTVA